MRQIYKDLVIGLILASFTFAPSAFAKPRSVKARSVTKAPLYAGMLKAVKKNKKGLKVSSFVESAKPMIKNREYKDIQKMALPYWDKKFDQFTIGKDYFKIKFKGAVLFGRYVDRGPVAFMVNNQPFLWKDILIYGRAKARLTEILMGKRAKKVSFIESVLNDFFPKAHARGKADSCENIEGAQALQNENGAYTGCKCPDGITISPADEEPSCPTGPIQCPDDQTRNADGQCVEAGRVIVTEPPGEKKEISPWLIGAGLVAIIALILILKKKKKDPEGGDDDTPTPGWTPEPEGQCPTPGARGLTEADLPPECRTSSCGTTDSCGSTSGGVIY